MLKLLCKICATLTPSDIDIVEQMSNVATILSNILDMDVFLDCPRTDVKCSNYIK